MTSSPNPSKALIPAAIAISLLDDGDDDVTLLDWLHDAATAAASVAVTLFRVVGEAAIPGTVVTVDVKTAVVVSVSFGNVEPDVRLKMICPASTKNGDELPLVLTKQLLLAGSMLLQQCIVFPLTLTVYIGAPPSVLTATH